MKIKMLLNVGTSETKFPHLKEGEHDVSDEVGTALIERGWAVAAGQPSTIKAIPSASTIQTGATVGKAAEDLKTHRAK